MIGARIGHYFDRLLAPLARRLSLHPDTITILGFLVTSAASVVMAMDLRLGGLLVLVGGGFDMLDGAVARAGGRATRFGAFLDSTLDRYCDAFILLGVAWNLGASGNHAGTMLSLGSLVGAFLVSYTRARAEGLGVECKTGLMERPERIVLLVAGALTGWMTEALWAMLVLTHLTVIQRILHVRRSIGRA